MGEDDERWASWQLRGRVTNAELYRSRDQVLERAGIRRGDRVVDVGCGTGLLALAALDSVGATGQVIGVDISQAALDACRAAAPPGQAARLITRWGSALRADAERYLAFLADGVSCGGYRFRWPTAFITAVAR